MEQGHGIAKDPRVGDGPVYSEIAEAILQVVPGISRIEALRIAETAIKKAEALYFGDTDGATPGQEQRNG
jgi:hypothetical protein